MTNIKLNKKIKNYDAGVTLSEEIVFDLPVSELFKISIDDEKKMETLRQLRSQYDNAKTDIQERFEDKVLKSDKVMIYYQV